MEVRLIFILGENYNIGKVITVIPRLQNLQPDILQFNYNESNSNPNINTNIHINNINQLRILDIEDSGNNRNVAVEVVLHSSNSNYRRYENFPFIQNVQ
jgi:hypothetical protein